jgi:hypothetical protein
MTDQPALPFQRHSPTSQAAAESMGNPATLRRKVYELLAGAHMGWGRTDEEIQDALGMPANTERPRRRELERAGLVRDSGRKRPTRSGRSAVVWEVI